MNAIADLARYRALEHQSAALAREALAAPPGGVRDEMCAEALAMVARLLELECEAA